MRFLDPARTKLSQFLPEGRSSPLAEARSRFGSPRDYSELADQVAQAGKDGSEVVIDLTPFERIGRPEVVAGRLTPVLGRCSCTLLTMESEPLRVLEEASVLQEAAAVCFDAAGVLVRTLGQVSGSEGRLATLKKIETHGTLQSVHREVADSRLSECLADGIERGDHPPNGVPAVQVGGKPYLVMPNGMLVSCYLNAKKVFRTPKRLLTAAFEISRTLFESFRRDRAGEIAYDAVVAPSNSALLLAAAVQAVTGVAACAIDRVGPVPPLNLARLSPSLPLRGKRVCLLVDVSATGGEIDRSVQYLWYQKAALRQVICCYNLDVGRTVVCPGNVVISLCHPKTLLGYEYRSL